MCKVLNGVNHIKVNVRVCCACMCERAAIGYFYTWLAHLIAWNDSRSWNVIKRGLAEKTPLLTPTDAFTVSGRNEAYPELLCLLIFNFEWSKHLRERKKEGNSWRIRALKAVFCAYVIRLALISNSFAVIFGINSATFLSVLLSLFTTPSGGSCFLITKLLVHQFTVRNCQFHFVDPFNLDAML